MSTSALTVQQRHLALPEACLFAPSQLSIPRSISKEDFLVVAAKLKTVANAEDFWLADAAHFAKKWDDGLQLMAETVGRTKYHLVRVAQVAERFVAARRFSYTVAHLRWLMPFPDEFLDRFLPSAANLNLSVKALRARAENEFGENPYKPKKPKKRNVPLRADLWARLSEHAPTKVSALIDFILEDWLRREHGGQPLTDAQKQDRYRERKRWREQQGKPAATTYHDDKQHPEASKVPVGARPEAGKDKQSTSAQPPTPVVPEAKPDYAARRQQQIAAGAKKIEPKPERKFKLRLQWTECRPGKSYLDSENGPTQFRGKGSEHPHKFFSEADAIAAEQRHFEECGYHELVVRCEECHCWHVRHRYSAARQAS